jgi:hypothetical protein
VVEYTNHTPFFFSSGATGHKRRDRETQDDIKAGKQLKLSLYTPLESIDDHTSIHFHQSVASSEPGVIHDVVDEEENIYRKI